MTSPDLSPYHLFICTPMMDGKVEDTYQISLDNTNQLLRAHGATVELRKMKYCADIYYARNRLFGDFLRHETATHMLFIDADMGWNPQDVAHMLMLDRDLLAVAGPKKIYPLTFAFSLIDDYSRELPLYHELETNVAEVSEVGAAFMMISRNCAQKIADAHPELEFDNPEGVTEHAVFDPLIINKGKEYPRRRLSEDYAFCYRWRQLGGKVEVLLDATLTHTGGHTFKGSLYEELCKKDSTFNLPVEEMRLKNVKT